MYTVMYINLVLLNCIPKNEVKMVSFTYFYHN